MKSPSDKSNKRVTSNEEADVAIEQLTSTAAHDQSLYGEGELVATTNAPGPTPAPSELTVEQVAPATGGASPDNEPNEPALATSKSDSLSDFTIASKDTQTDSPTRAMSQRVVSCLEDLKHGHLPDQLEKRIGLGIRELVNCAKSAPVALFILLWTAKRLLNRQGCQSRFNEFLQNEAPFISRKSADRFASIIEHFTKGDPEQVARLARAMNLINRTALYELAKPHVAHEARISALDFAHQGITVTKTIARQLILKNGSTESPKAARFVLREFETSIGRVTFRLANDNVDLALKEIADQLAAERP